MASYTGDPRRKVVISGPCRRQNHTRMRVVAEFQGENAQNWGDSKAKRDEIGVFGAERRGLHPVFGPGGD